MTVQSVNAGVTNLQLGALQDEFTGTISVTMLRNVYNPSGTLLQAKTTQSVSGGFARWLVENQYATTTDSALPVVSSPGIDGTTQRAVRALVSGGGNLATPLLIAKSNQTFSRASANTAADNIFGTLYSFTLPGGTMGPNGTLRWEVEVGFTDPATNVTSNGFQLRIGAVGICPEFSNSTSGNLFENRYLEWHNTAAGAQKYRGSFLKQAGSATGFTTTAIDTTVDQTIDFACRWSGATSGETLSLLSIRVWVEYGA